MKAILNRLINHESISSEEAKNVLVKISEGQYNQSQIASFLTIYMMRSITLEELQGFRDALLELCIPVDLSDFNAIDLCGTGGDGKDTFNISTLASFITAGAGVKVAKHGNYGVSSASGSSNVMEALGVKFTNNVDQLKRCTDEAGICVMHAPLFHPAMKNVAPIRRELGVKTFFNMLGPMVNPAFPKNQMVGVFNLELQRIYGYLYQNTDKNYSIIHALDGYDEISLTGKTKIISNASESMLIPSDLGIDQIEASEIFGGATVKEAAKIFKRIINGDGTEAQNNVVCANAGLAIATVEQISHQEGFARAKESLKNGRAKTSLEKLIELSN
ncbi:anthranilate phosphoribosyltransferase [Psychroserpens sp.]|uniref:anthranilate phosphoribosyltransferase n=1 Tax=Psychroserpens sp. TaxID=2020870 RepID=UPI001B114A56|nr:anthranilate phosphoribosyltransferase [Psychroserpens sp.]MBO6606076.1 anthranilate phosphoribosyltransferase [Psychroserpens sp.]MBO6652553.1 anthranilate phosphoribosyltransferase [Psychroserpens sp.]MBO6681675.1 anthranilate phosphoribosyltransferase [Psychroserpens sp.]MBO6749450.1 anthranilate phosphoribosyltransferase [Psychroserpens sp.]MBO6914104.1 anthranilate phosphoribosyltransferase [Psychroserpens sp.]